jgi:hypothetical protein
MGTTRSTAAALSTRDEQPQNRDAVGEYSIDSWSQLRMLNASRFCMRSFFIPVFKCVKTVSHRAHREHREIIISSVFSVRSVAIYSYENRCKRLFPMLLALA